jgi:hypothetical protein
VTILQQAIRDRRADEPSATKNNALHFSNIPCKLILVLLIADLLHKKEWIIF